MSIQDQLEQAKARFLANVPEIAQESIFQQMEEQQQSGRVFGLDAGLRAPNFTLTNIDGQPFTLYDELAKGPVVLTFYRGSWCPYCNIQLRGYEQILPDIKRYGCQLAAVSLQSQENSLSQAEKEKLTFPVLRDPGGLVSDSYNLLFDLPAYLQNTYTHILNLDLLAFNETGRWVLPVPATFLIDSEGVIRSASVIPDFMQRLEPSEIIEQLKKL
ncbi:peroxiredoxin-like family protein [Paenibacillus turpanensis]|uniref:peroxiredoxin-like family protein n=1 Tax=Paenibacillus turpanensis TaxID=2689078 RepID=UPI00140E1D39|nr:peroxiredoxin-like family protein [Paenibacillus turpanensis]